MTTLLEIGLNSSDKILVKYVLNPRGKLSIFNNSQYEHNIKIEKRSSPHALLINTWGDDN